MGEYVVGSGKKMLQLPSCPFCGSSRISSKTRVDLGPIRFFYCETCGMVVSFAGYSSDEQQVEAYCRRPIEKEKEDG